MKKLTREMIIAQYSDATEEDILQTLEEFEKFSEKTSYITDDMLSSTYYFLRELIEVIHIAPSRAIVKEEIFNLTYVKKLNEENEQKLVWEYIDSSFVEEEKNLIQCKKSNSYTDYRNTIADAYYELQEELEGLEEELEEMKDNEYYTASDFEAQIKKISDKQTEIEEFEEEMKGMPTYMSNVYDEIKD